MEINNSFTVEAPVEEAWALLTDIPQIAPCLPGAQLTGQEADTYSGTVKVKVGPVTAEYKGTAEFVERDDAAHKAVLFAKGRDSRGAGNAQAEITARLTPAGTGTTVEVSTDLKISGKVAQFGRGVMQDVSEKLLGQFAECLAGKLAGPAEEPAPETTEAGDDDTAGASPTKNSTRPTQTSAPHAGAEDTSRQQPEALDLLDVAGDAMAKRLRPVAIGLGVIVLLLVIRRLMRGSGS